MVGRLVGRFWVRRFLIQATRQATKPKMAMDISAGLPNIGRRLSPLSPRRARRTTHATIATYAARDAWIHRKNPEQRGGDVLAIHVARSYWIRTIRTTGHST